MQIPEVNVHSQDIQCCWNTQEQESVSQRLVACPPEGLCTICVGMHSSLRSGLAFRLEFVEEGGASGYGADAIVEWAGPNRIVFPLAAFKPFGSPKGWSTITTVRMIRSEPSRGEVLTLGEIAFSAAHLPRPVNPYEDILEAFFLPDFWRPENWQVRSSLPLERHAVKQDWFHGYLVMDNPEVGSWVTMQKVYPGGIDLNPYEALVGQISLQRTATCDIELKIDGSWQGIIQNHTGTCAFDELVGQIPRDARRLGAVRIRMRCAKAGDPALRGSLFWFLLQKKGADTSAIRRYGVSPALTPLKQARSAATGAESLPAGLYFGPEDVASLRQKATQGLGKAMWAKIENAANAQLDCDVESYVGEFLPMRRKGLTRRFAAENINWPEIIPQLGLAYWITDKAAYGDKCKEMVLGACRCKHWGSCFVDRFPVGVWGYRAPFWPASIASAVATGMDWVGHLFTDNERQFVADALMDKAVFWIEQYLDRMEYCRTMNQGVVFSVGGILASLAARRGCPEADSKATKLTEYLIDALQGCIDEDGVSGEGAIYLEWVLFVALRALVPLMRRSELSRVDSLGKKLTRSLEYLLYLRSHSGEGFVPLNIGDANPQRPDMSPVWLFLARYFGRTDALAPWYDSYGTNDAVPEDVLSFILFDPDQKPSGHDLPVNRCFRRSQRVFWRTGWDREDVLFMFESGRWGPDHYHLDKNQFILEAFGDRFIIDPGIGDYSDPQCSERIKTCRHNTITVDGRDQVAVGGGPAAELEDIKECTEYCYLRSQAGATYGDLESFTREVLFVRPDYFVVADDLAGLDGQVEWNLHSQFAPEPIDDGFILRGRHGSLLIHVAAPSEWTWKLSQHSSDDPDVTDFHLAISPAEPSRRCKFVVAIFPVRAEMQADVRFRHDDEDTRGSLRVEYPSHVDEITLSPRLALKRL